MLCVSSWCFQLEWSVECCHTVKFYGFFTLTTSLLHLMHSSPKMEIVIKKFIRIYDANIKLMSISCWDARNKEREFCWKFSNFPFISIHKEDIEYIYSERGHEWIERIVKTNICLWHCKMSFLILKLHLELWNEYMNFILDSAIIGNKCWKMSSSYQIYPLRMYLVLTLFCAFCFHFNLSASFLPIILRFCWNHTKYATSYATVFMKSLSCWLWKILSKLSF